GVIWGFTVSEGARWLLKIGWQVGIVDLWHLVLRVKFAPAAVGTFGAYPVCGTRRVRPRLIDYIYILSRIHSVSNSYLPNVAYFGYSRPQCIQILPYGAH